MRAAVDAEIQVDDHLAWAGRSQPAGQPMRITFEDVSVRYGAATVLTDLNLSIAAGEFVALIGPSGSGKTTALRTLAGFVTPSSGQVRIDGQDVTRVPPARRGIGMVVQSYALFPHMRVHENVAFGLRARRVARSVVAQRVAQCLETVGMSQFAQRYPRELSGGQQQRVAIARALAIEPSVLLLDEPLSALDAQIRRAMVDELNTLHDRCPSLTVLYVTHDQSEALTLADRIGIMRGGRLVAYDTARALYLRPPNRFCAEFLGHANILTGVVTDHGAPDGLSAVQIGDFALQGRHVGRPTRGQACCVAIRSHHLHLAPRAELSHHLDGVVSAVHWRGEAYQVDMHVCGQGVRLRVPVLDRLLEPGQRLRLHVDARDVTIMPADANHG